MCTCVLNQYSIPGIQFLILLVALFALICKYRITTSRSGMCAEVLMG